MKADRVVVDTNVLISALLTPKGKPGQTIRHFANNESTLLLSRVTFLELASRLAKPKFDSYEGKPILTPAEFINTRLV